MSNVNLKFGEYKTVRITLITIVTIHLRFRRTMPHRQTMQKGGCEKR